MSFACTSGQSTATIKSGGGATLATDNASGATNTANQYADKVGSTLGPPPPPDLTDGLVQAARTLQAQKLLQQSSRSQALAGGSGGGGSVGYSLLGK